MDSSDDDQDFPDDDDFGDLGGSCVTRDLFSDATFDPPRECLLDAKKRHGLDFGYVYTYTLSYFPCYLFIAIGINYRSIVRENRMDCFAFFKLVNFIRSNRPKPSEVDTIVRD